MINAQENRRAFKGTPFYFQGSKAMQMQERMDEEEYGWTDLFEAGQVLNNPFYAEAKHGRGRRSEPFKTEDNFSVFEQWTQQKIMDAGYNPKDFIGVRSGAELDWKMTQAARQRRYRKIIDGSGWAGVASEIAGGVLNPLVLATIPFGGGLVAGGRVAAGIAAEMVMAAGAEGLSEIMLHAQQPERTMQETLSNIVLSTGFAGGLAGGLGMLSRRAGRANAKLMDDGMGEFMDRDIRAKSADTFEYNAKSKILDDIAETDEIARRERLSTGQRAPDGTFPLVKNADKSPKNLADIPVTGNRTKFFKSEKAAQKAASRIAESNPNAKLVVVETNEGFQLRQIVEFEPARDSHGVVKEFKTEKAALEYNRRSVEFGRSQCRIL